MLMSKRLHKAFLLLIIFVVSFLITCLITPMGQNLNRNFDSTKQEGINQPQLYTNPPDINYPINQSDLSNLFYIYRNATWSKANITWNAIYSIAKDALGGYNSSNINENRKDLSANIEAGITLIDMYEANLSLEYLNEVKVLIEFIFETFWNETTDLFITSVNRTGGNPSNISYCSENVKMINFLLDAYQLIENDTYLDFANRTILGLNQTLWDQVYSGYFSNNNDSDLNGNKYLYDNALSMLANFQIYNHLEFSQSTRDLARNNFEILYDKVFSDFKNGSYGYFSMLYRNWSLKDLSTNKNVRDNSMMLEILIELYRTTNNRVYYQETIEQLNFLNKFIDNSKAHPAFVYEVDWNGDNIINDTFYLDYNSLLISDYLKLFEITNNGTYYLSANNYYNFLNSYLWDPNLNSYNYSITFVGINNSNKFTSSNSLAIRSFLHFRVENFYLTRANTTMSLVLNHFQTNDAINLQISNDLSYSLIPNFINLPKSKYASSNAYAISSLLTLAESTGNQEYIENAKSIATFLIENMRIENGFVYNASDNGNVGTEIYSCEDNALLIESFIDLYEKTGNATYLEIANDTWYFINSTFWDRNNGGYNYTTGPDRFILNFKTLKGNMRAIKANLKIVQNSYAIFDPIRDKASLLANITLNLINDKLWDQVNYGYYYNATEDWGPIVNKNNSKKIDVNSLALRTLLNYNNIYPGHVNFSLYNDYCENLTNFFLNNFLDSKYGGIFPEGWDNGTIVIREKSLISNAEFVLALLAMYDEFGEINYYKNASALVNYINFYYWDYEYGGYYSNFYRRGTPRENYFSLYGIDYKIYLKGSLSNLYGINILIEISKINMNKDNFLIAVENNQKNYDFNEHEVVFKTELYDSDGNKINTSKVEYFIKGSESTDRNTKNIFGIGSKYDVNYVGNQYSTDINISNFLNLIYIGINAFNDSIIPYFQEFRINRSLPRYLQIAYDNINYLPTNLVPSLKLWDSENFGYFTRVNSDNKSAFSNLMAVRALNNFLQTAGVSFALDWSSGTYEQIIDDYLNNTLSYLENLSYVNNTDNIKWFISSTSSEDQISSSKIFCKDNALAIITYLELYNVYNDPSYLEIANQTWKYINETFWDDENKGFMKSNWSNNESIKDLETQIWSILAYLSIYNTSEINEIIRNSSLTLINITINNILNNLWDSGNSGFFAEFNSTTWEPLNDSQSCKTTLDNSLAINMLLKLNNTLNNITFYNKAKETLQFINIYLYNTDFGGFYTSLNATNHLTNTNKSTSVNAYMIDALLDFYLSTNNYSYYDQAEKTAFYITTFTQSYLYTIFLPKTSEIGSAMGQETKITSISNFLVINSFINLEKIRTTFDRPPSLSNITTNQFDISSTQKQITIYFEIRDENITQMENLSVIAYVYGIPEIYEFTRSDDNITYYRTFDISRFSESVNFHILVLNKTYASTYRTYSYNREYPTYIKIAFQSMATLYTYLQSNYSSFYDSGFGYKIGTSGNLLSMQSILDIVDFVGSTYLSFNWYGNNTLLNSVNLISNFLKNNLTSEFQNETGFLSYYQQGNTENLTTLHDNALAVISYLDIFESTNNTEYLELANDTWMYLNKTFWNSSWNCFESDNSTMNYNISIQDNFLAILAGIRINQTFEINNSIRNNALLIANLTFNTINNSFWDDINGGYFSSANGTSWSRYDKKDTKSNSLGILVNLEMYEKIENNTSYYKMANKTASELIDNLWDPVYNGFYRQTYSNWSLPNSDSNTSKYTLDNSWASIALTELYNLTHDSEHYYYSEAALQFLITYMGNITSNLVIKGFFIDVNRTGYRYGYPSGNFYPGSLESSSLCIQALILLFNVANITYSGDWLNGSTEITGATMPPTGEYANISFRLKDKNNNTVTGEINVTVIKWKMIESIGYQTIYNNLDISYNENSSTYNIGNVNFSDCSHIFVYISGRNDSYASFYNYYFVIRVSTDIRSAVAFKDGEELQFLPIYGTGGADPETDYAFYAYVLGEDRIHIKGKYIDERGFGATQGIPNAGVNISIYFPNNGSKWESKIVYTNHDGWFEVYFGPTGNQSILEGIYNISIIASHVNTSVSPRTWFSTSEYLMRISVGYGLFISNFTTKNYTIAQGDLFNVNITIKNERIDAADTNISFYGENNSLIQLNKSVTVDSGFTSFKEDLRIDNRVKTGEYIIFAEITYQGRWIHTQDFTITIQEAVEIRSVIIPNKISQDDEREFRIEVENNKRRLTSQILIKLSSEALIDKSISKVLQPNETKEFSIAFRPYANIPFGTHSGVIEITRQNYTVEYLGSKQYEFNIEIATTLDVIRCEAPSTLLQGQPGYITLFLENHRAIESQINIVYYWEGTNQVNSNNYTLTEYYEEEYIYLPISYTGGPLNFGSKKLIVDINYINENDEIIEVYQSEQSVNIQLSALGYFINYFLPFLISLVAVIVVMYILMKKREEKKRKKK
ncbi:MAG: hypothetical protein GF329_12565 [Candidatus Lokiarchaeota archaeon]|nr:hypothetical protein [Candidatus Lokiarchaeota archaeon]